MNINLWWGLRFVGTRKFPLEIQCAPEPAFDLHRGERPCHAEVHSRGDHGPVKKALAIAYALDDRKPDHSVLLARRGSLRSAGIPRHATRAQAEELFLFHQVGHFVDRFAVVHGAGRVIPGWNQVLEIRTIRGRIQVIGDIGCTRKRFGPLGSRGATRVGG